MPVSTINLENIAFGTLLEHWLQQNIIKDLWTLTVEWGRGIVDELILSCPVCSLERILHFVIANSFIRSISDDKIELNRYDKIENCLNVSLSANFWMLAWALIFEC